MTKKLLSAALASLLLVSCASFTASAADEKVVYLEAGATGDGSEEDPFGTLEEAIFSLNNEDGTICVYGTFDITEFKFSAWTGMVTITGASADSVLKVDQGKAAIFSGPTTIKDIGIDIGDSSHFNNDNAPLIYDPGDDTTLEGFFHLGAYGDWNADESYCEINSGRVQIVWAAGGYSPNYDHGVAGDNTVVVNGGTVAHLNIAADHYMDTQTGITVGGNLNIIQNGGTIENILADEATLPEIFGALNIIFNNGIEAPANFIYPEDAAAEGNYIIYSGEGGSVMPTAQAGVFEIKAESGKVAQIDGKQVFDGKVTLDEGETIVSWVKGEQPVQETESIGIKLTIGDANIITNGESKALDVPAQTIDNRTMVPLRAIFEALGAEIEWNGETRTVTSVKDDTTVSLTVGENAITVNGEVKELDVPAQIKDNRTLVPVRAISEAFGCDVAWDGETRTVTITK